MAKLRLGYGTTGSDRIPPYGFSPVVISNVDYILGEDPSLISGLTQPGYADPNLKWESNISKNIGLDLTFKGGKAGLEIDLYEQDKEDMLLAITTPISAGSTPVNGETYDRFLTNIGDLRNRGIEINAYYNHEFGPVSTKFSANFTKNENKVVKLSREGEVIFDGYPNIIRVNQTEPVAVLEAGLPVGAFKVYETNGTIKTDEELAAILAKRTRIEKIAIKDTKLRSFITQDDGRDDLVAHVYDITYGSLKKTDNLVIIDDSIVRGTTLKKSILKMLDRLNPKQIVIVSSAPQIRYPDCYGIDMARLEALIAFQAALALHKDRGTENIVDAIYIKCKSQETSPDPEQINHVKELYAPFTDEEISDKIAEIISEKSIKADVKVIFQSVVDLHKACPNNLGDWYFTGNYPTPGGNRVVNKAFINFIEGNSERAY